MTTIQLNDRRHRPDWPYSETLMHELQANLRQQAYPPVRRSGAAVKGERR